MVYLVTGAAIMLIGILVGACLVIAVYSGKDEM